MITPKHHFKSLFSQESFVADEDDLGDDLEQVEALQSKFDAYQRVSAHQYILPHWPIVH